MVTKSDVRERILIHLREEFALQTRAAHLARDEAISEESRPENQYDMHSQEAAYLAEGQARLAAAVAESITLYEGLPVAPLATDAAVSLGALVCVEGGEKRAWYFLGPRAGGVEVQVDGVDVLVLTPASPLGRELLGKHVGDAVRVPGASQPHRIAVLR